jgi:hypothetical protein
MTATDKRRGDRVVRLAPDDPAPAPAEPARLDPQALASLQAAWIDWAKGMLAGNRLPLSGNVDQWIRTWGEAVSQVGLLNVNVAGSSDPQLEQKIGSRYSYGRQLGRMLDVLAPLVEANRATIEKTAGRDKVDDFRKMVGEIHDLKRQPGVDDIVAKVSRWRDSPTFQQDLAELLRQLGALSTAPK